MDGVTFLRKIMTLRPMPVVMISTLTQAGAEITLEALEIGAVDFIAKPVHDVAIAHGRARRANCSPRSRRRRDPHRARCGRSCVQAAGARSRALIRRERQDRRHRRIDRWRRGAEGQC